MRQTIKQGHRTENVAQQNRALKVTKSQIWSSTMSLTRERHPYPWGLKTEKMGGTFSLWGREHMDAGTRE